MVVLRRQVRGRKQTALPRHGQMPLRTTEVAEVGTTYEYVSW